MSQPTVAILACAHSSASVVYGMYDLFRSAGRDWEWLTGGEPGPGVLLPTIVAAKPGPLSVINDVVITPQATLDALPVPDIVCVPEVGVDPTSDLRTPYGAEIEWLQHCHRNGAILASSCSGALLFAESGLLDGHEAASHWAFCDAMAIRYPKIRMRPRSTLIASGEGQRIVMAGGGVSWLDLALYIIARVAGVECALQTARVHLINWHSVGQQPYAQLARLRQGDDALIARCQAWIAENYQAPAPVAAMMRISGLTERTFSRRFQQATGHTPMEYVHTLRMEESKQMLETGDTPVEAIANAVGYEDPGFFSRLFKRNVGLTPMQYRRRFGGLRGMLQSRVAGASAKR